VLTHLHGSRHYTLMRLKDILSNFSWDTLISLPPSELLSLLFLTVLAVALTLSILLGIVTALGDR
jgi:hypothetical protein